jgi:hypothetical protein
MRPARVGAIALAAALAGLAGPSGAGAATYCAGPETNPVAGGCDVMAGGVREALDAAGSHAGDDIVLIPGGDYTFDTGLFYDDRGQPDNGVTIQGAPICERYGCRSTSIRGGTPGGALLSFGGGGGAVVRAYGFSLFPGAGVTGVVLPPGAEAGVVVYTEPAGTGVRVEGTAARPVKFAGSVFAPGGVAVDAPGHGILEGIYLTGDVGARVRDGGMLDLRGGEIHAGVGVTGTAARLTAVAMNFGEPEPVSGPTVGFEAVCPDPAAPDAEIELTGVTLLGTGAPDSTGVRATAKGGDGDSCDARVRLNSTAIAGVATSLDARGDQGSGTDPRAGTGRIHAEYSAFDPARTASAGPAALETASPGGNVYEDPRFYRDVVGFPYLFWNSPLIDRGDPGPMEPWQTQYTPVIHGRRDIGRYEYRFEPPGARIDVLPSTRTAPGREVELTGGGYDNDPGDRITWHWTFSDGSTSIDRHVFRVYDELGTYEERFTVTDPTGQSTTASATITVVKQRLMGLTIDPAAFRAARGKPRPPAAGATIGYALAVRGGVRFTVERRVRRRHGRSFRWVRLPGRIRRFAEAGHSSLDWGGRIGGRRLRPGRYRLVGHASAGPPRRARFRVLR